MPVPTVRLPSNDTVAAACVLLIATFAAFTVLWKSAPLLLVTVTVPTPETAPETAIAPSEPALNVKLYPPPTIVPLPAKEMPPPPVDVSIATSDPSVTAPLMVTGAGVAEDIVNPPFMVTACEAFPSNVRPLVPPTIKGVPTVTIVTPPEPLAAPIVKVPVLRPEPVKNASSAALMLRPPGVALATLTGWFRVYG